MRNAIALWDGWDTLAEVFLWVRWAAFALVGLLGIGSLGLFAAAMYAPTPPTAGMVTVRAVAAATETPELTPLPWWHVYGTPQSAVRLTLSSGRQVTLTTENHPWVTLAAPGERLRAVTSRSYLDRWLHTETITYSPEQ